MPHSVHGRIQTGKNMYILRSSSSSSARPASCRAPAIVEASSEQLPCRSGRISLTQEVTIFRPRHVCDVGLPPFCDARASNNQCRKDGGTDHRFRAQALKSVACHAILACSAFLLTNCRPPSVGNDADVAATPRSPGLSATSAPTVSTGLSDAEASQITYDAGQLIANRTYYDVGLGGMSCSNYFNIGYLKVKDVLLDRDQGKVVISYVVTAIHPIPHYGGDYFPKQCYGQPAEGWSLHQSANSTDEFKIERWQSGWRLAQNQGR